MPEKVKVTIFGVSEMSQKNFTLHKNSCVEMKLPNGLVISLNLGAGGYNENHWNHDFQAQHVETDTAEVAVWHEDGKPRTARNARWITKQFFPDAEDGDCSVAAYVTMEEFSQALVTMIGWKP